MQSQRLLRAPSFNQIKTNGVYRVSHVTLLIECYFLRAVITGIFNCVNEGLARRVDYVEAIFKYAGLSVALQSVSGLTLARKANVSNNEMAENWKMTQYGLPPMPDWRQSLQKYIFDITT